MLVENSTQNAKETLANCTERMFGHQDDAALHPYVKPSSKKNIKGSLCQIGNRLSVCQL